MGMFSQLCKGCDRSIVADFDTGVERCSDDGSGIIGTWMSQAVVLTPEGSILRGSYNGYGRVGGCEGAIGRSDNESWHEACWQLAGSPMEYTGASDDDQDQGMWTYDLVGISDPRTTYSGQRTMESLRAKAAAASTEQVLAKKKTKKAIKGGSGVGFFIPGLNSSDPQDVRKALAKLVLDPDKYLV